MCLAAQTPPPMALKLSPHRRIAMTDTIAPKPDAAPAPFVRYTPEQALRQKQNRDDRRKAIRGQNAASKVMR